MHSAKSTYFINLHFSTIMKELDNFYHQLDEPIKGTMLALREIILQQDHNIATAWKYKLPFFVYKGRMFCYLWIHKKYKQPYIGIVEGNRINHPLLITEKRARMKIMLFDPMKDLPIKIIEQILEQTLHLYKSGIVKTK
jgi:hypothetical protein